MASEFIGTFWLVLGGCGSAVLAARFPDVGIGLVGIALAFGLTVLTIAYSLGHIHLISIPVTNTSVNPARSISQAIFVGDWAISQLWLFIFMPVLGAIAAGVVYKFLSKK